MGGVIDMDLFVFRKLQDRVKTTDADDAATVLGGLAREWWERACAYEDALKVPPHTMRLHPEMFALVAALALKAGFGDLRAMEAPAFQLGAPNDRRTFDVLVVEEPALGSVTSVRMVGSP